MLSWDEFNQEEMPTPVTEPKIEQPPVISEVVQEALKPALDSKMGSVPTAADTDAGTKKQVSGGTANSSALQKAISDLQSLNITDGVEELEGSANRVKVDDKRMINCRADLNQLVPFKYDWAWQ